MIRKVTFRLLVWGPSKWHRQSPSTRVSVTSRGWRSPSGESTSRHGLRVAAEQPVHGNLRRGRRAKPQRFLTSDTSISLNNYTFSFNGTGALLGQSIFLVGQSGTLGYVTINEKLNVGSVDPTWVAFSPMTGGSYVPTGSVYRSDGTDGLQAGDLAYNAGDGTYYDLLVGTTGPTGAPGVPGNSNTTYQYKFSTSTTPPPASNYLEFGSSTQLYISNLDKAGEDIGTLSPQVPLGSQLTIQAQTGVGSFTEGRSSPHRLRVAAKLCGVYALQHDRTFLWSVHPG